MKSMLSEKGAHKRRSLKKHITVQYLLYAKICPSSIVFMEYLDWRMTDFFVLFGKVTVKILLFCTIIKKMKKIY